jgi:hypothetical protein
MPTITLYRYRVFDSVRRRWYVTHPMTEQEAGRLEMPTRLEWSREVREVGPDPLCNSTSAFFRRLGQPDQ